MTYNRNEALLPFRPFQTKAIPYLVVLAGGLGEFTMSIFEGRKLGFKCQFIEDYVKLGQFVTMLKSLGYKVVVTIGTWDLFHCGHARYLALAAEHGNVLIVGTDTDRAVKLYKDPSRPMVPQLERLEMLYHTRYVDFMTLVDDIDEQGVWQYGLLKATRPDVYVAVEGSYSPEQLQEIGLFCGEVVILPRQAKTSTTERIRKATAAHLQKMMKQLEEEEG